MKKYKVYADIRGGYVGEGASPWRQVQ